MAIRSVAGACWRPQLLRPLLAQSLSPSSGMSTAPLFRGRTDRFRGVTVTSRDEPCAPGEFQDRLDKSVQAWKEKVRFTTKIWRLK